MKEDRSFWLAGVLVGLLFLMALGWMADVEIEQEERAYIQAQGARAVIYPAAATIK